MYRHPDWPAYHFAKADQSGYKNSGIGFKTFRPPNPVAFHKRKQLTPAGF